MATRVEQTEPPLIVIVGPTASGKTNLAIKLAKELDGEIICADSRTIYRGMDIGTAKPTLEEQQQVVHWGLDLVEPNDLYTVADFKEYAVEKIADIRARGKVPFLVGGSGLYIDAVIFDYQFGERADAAQRLQLESMTLEGLIEYCKNNNITLPENSKNKRYVVRAIERSGRNVQRQSAPISTSIIVGIATDKTILRQRIAHRSEQILTNGVVEEAIVLGEKYGWQSEAMTGNIYPLVHSYLKQEYNARQIEDMFTTSDWRLAKRQLTWFRRNPYIMWLDRSDATEYVRSTLAT